MYLVASWNLFSHWHLMKRKACEATLQLQLRILRGLRSLSLSALLVVQKV